MPSLFERFIFVIYECFFALDYMRALELANHDWKITELSNRRDAIARSNHKENHRMLQTVPNFFQSVAGLADSSFT